MHVIVLRGGMGKKQREAMAAELAAVSTAKGRVILATGRYIGEGFDDARLDTLFLTLPVSWHGTIAQYAGRLHRLYDGKRDVRIYDFCCRQQKSYFVAIPVMWRKDTAASSLGTAFHKCAHVLSHG